MSDIAQQVQREVNSRDWLAKNKARVLRACKITNPEDESPEALAAAQAFVKMMENVIERSYGGEYSMQNLDLAFKTLCSRGLLTDPTPPPPPAPKPKLYYLELRIPGADTKTRGPFSAQDAIARAQYYAREQTSIIIRDAATGEAVDMDLQPLRDNPLGHPRPQTVRQITQSAQTEADEYLSFYNKNSISKITGRASHDVGFRNWLEGMKRASLIQASSGGVDEHGNRVEPVRL